MVQGPMANLELPLTPSAAVLIAKVVVGDADIEAARGGAPNNQGITLNVRG